MSKSKIGYFLLIILLSFISFYPAFNFSFIVDDWYLLWGVFFDKTIIAEYLRTQHPNVVYEFLLLAPIFKFNPFYYQVVGYILKVVDSFTVGLLILSVTKSRTAALFSSITFAASEIGIEAFTRIGAQNSALLIPTLSLGFYFWFKAKEGNSITKYLVSLMFIVLGLLGDPGTGIVIVPVIVLWEVLNLIQKYSRQNLKRVLIHTGLLFLTIIFITRIFLDSKISDRQDYISKHLIFIANNLFFTTANFLTSIGNFLMGWVISFPEYTHLGSPSIVTMIFGGAFVISIAILGMIFILKKKESSKVVLFLSIFSLLFYLPSWLTQTHYVEGGAISAASNRYFAISSIGLLGLISYLITIIKSTNFRFIVIALVVLLQLWSANRVLIQEAKYRTTKVQNILYSQINKDAPKGSEQRSLYVFLGNSWLRIVGLGWNGFFPLALQRGIINIKEFPAIVNNLQLAKEDICPLDKSTPKYSLADMYAWEVDEQSIYNVTEQARKLVNDSCAGLSR